MKPNANVRMVEAVAQGLGELRDRVVFVGGAVTSLYVDDPHSPPVTVSDDVDCVIEVAGLLEYGKIEKLLYKQGFKRPVDEEHQKIICRWEFMGIVVDVMPTDESILGFSNRWYKDAIKAREAKSLPDGTSISVFSLPYFVATKFEALKARGGNDLRFSQDLEDIAAVLDGCSTAEAQLSAVPGGVRKYIQDECARLLAEPEFMLEALEGFLRDQARASRVMQIVVRTAGSR
ncbi:MAG: hypothetical protein IT285_03430 [Bdellovibrionales bacterium]|nr:hypothetical protein [Bdellovibrionales bacterium]